MRAKRSQRITESIASVEQWVIALRSGEYEQAHEVLNDGEGMCCLGVFCDISDLGEWNYEHYLIEADEEPEGFYELDVELDDSPLADILTDCQIDEKVCIKMNDEEGEDFYTIADYLEGCLDRVFG